MLEVAAAHAIVLAQTRPRPAAPTQLTRETLGRVLAADILADRDSPPFTKSLRDGYAVRAADCPTGNVDLRLLGAVAAGAVFEQPVGPGEAVAITTGAPIPAGADAVVMQEDTEPLPPDQVRIRETSVRPGQHILPRGREMTTGEVVLPAGAVLTPVTLGLCATVGRTQAEVFPAPRLTVIATGSELVEPGIEPQPGQIRNSNGPMLLAQAQQAGAIPTGGGIVRDDPAHLREQVRHALTTADVVVLAGGVSVGRHDHVPAVLRELGVEIHFHTIRMKPGKPLLFGTLGDVLVFGLPGNPVSAFVGFELFVKPAVRKLSGHAVPGPRILSLPLAESFSTHGDRPTYHPAAITAEQQVRPLPWFGSPDLRGLLTATGFLIVPPGSHGLHPGQLMDVVVL